MTTRPRDDRRPLPPARTRAGVLAEYPSYLSPRVSTEPARVPSPLVSAVAAYAASFAAAFIAAIPLGIFVLVHGVQVASQPLTDDQINREAFTAAMIVIGVTSLVALLAAWGVLRLRGVRSAFVVAVLGQVADYVGVTAGGLVSDLAAYVLGATAGVGSMYLLIRGGAARR